MFAKVPTAPGRNFGTGGSEARQVAVHLGIETRERQPHGGRFSMDTMTAPHTYRIFMFHRAAFQRPEQRLHIRDQDIRGAGQLHVETGIQYVGRGHSLMYETRFVAADMFRKVGQKGDNIMFRHSLYFVNARDVEFSIPGFPDRLGIGPRNNAEIGHGIAGMCLDLEPDAELGFG